MSGISVRGGRIKKNKRSSDRYVDSVALLKPGVRTSIHTARAVRTEMPKEGFTAANVLNESNLTLLRICARNIRSVYEHLWCCHVGGGKVSILYDSKEGDCEGGSRFKELRDYVAQYIRLIEDLRTKIESSPRSKAAWKKCNNGGGSRK